MATKKQDYSKWSNSQKMALLKKQQAEYNKKFKNMTPAQKKAKLVGDAKKIGLTAAQVASMVGGTALVRKTATKQIGKLGEKIIVKKFGNQGRLGLVDAAEQNKGNVAAVKSILKNKKQTNRPDSPFLKFVEPKRKNTAAIQQTLKKLKENKNTPNNVTKLADYKKRKFRGK